VKTWWIRVKMRVLGSIARFALNRPQALQWGVRVLGPLALRRLRRKLSPPEQVRQMDGAIATLEREVARDRLWEDQLALGQLLVGRRRLRIRDTWLSLRPWDRLNGDASNDASPICSRETQARKNETTPHPAIRQERPDIFA
jgi:hypothetical protein